MFQIDDSGIYLTRGDTARLAIKVKYFQGEDYTLQDGDKLVFTVKKELTDTKPIFQYEGAMLTIQPEDTKKLEYGAYWFDVQLTRGFDGSIYTVIPPTLFKVMGEVS